MDITADYQDALPIGVPSITVTLTGNGSPAEAIDCVFMMDGMVYGMAINPAGQLSTGLQKPPTCNVILI